MKSAFQVVIQSKKTGFQATEVVNCVSSTVSQKDLLQYVFCKRSLADCDVDKESQIYCELFSKCTSVPYHSRHWNLYQEMTV